jgi:cytochrome c oxidase assembly protein subunit 11
VSAGSANGRVAGLLFLLVAVMVGASFAAVPLYNLFCRVTGFGGTTKVAETAPSEVLDKTIKVRFDGSVDKDMPWKFHPAVNEIELRIGETAIAYFEATNTSAETVTGIASYNVVPFAAGPFFVKIQCFCFSEQVLKPGETVQMPVNFFVDPGIVDDDDGKYVHTITLSYTFHRADLPTETSAVAPSAPADPVN